MASATNSTTALPESDFNLLMNFDILLGVSRFNDGNSMHIGNWVTSH